MWWSALGPVRHGTGRARRAAARGREGDGSGGRGRARCGRQAVARLPMSREPACALPPGGGRTSCRWPLAAGRWPLAAGRWPLAAGRWPLAAGRWPLAAGRWPLAAGRWPLAAGRWPLAAGRWQIIRANARTLIDGAVCRLIDGRCAASGRSARAVRAWAGATRRVTSRADGVAGAWERSNIAWNIARSPRRSGRRPFHLLRRTLTRRRRRPPCMQ